MDNVCNRCLFSIPSIIIIIIIIIIISSSSSSSSSSKASQQHEVRYGLNEPNDVFEVHVI